MPKRVAALEKKPAPTSLPPSGAAGGDLTGNYPSPAIANGALQAADLGSVTTGSIDIDSVAGGSCVNFAILDLPGADDGDIVLAVPTGGGAGIPAAEFDTTGELILMGIPHNSEAHVKVCNVSAAPIDPPSQSFRAVLIQG